MELKIERNGEILLSSIGATQEVAPSINSNIIRNINGFIVHKPMEGRRPLLSTITSKDPPNFLELKIGERFTITSIIEFMEFGNEPSIPFLKSSLKISQKFIKFRPIFEMVLSNFKCKTNSKNEVLWTLDFEGD